MHKISDLELLKWVGNFIDKQQLVTASRRVLVGLSGGPDSMLLSQVCEALKEQGRLQSVRHIHIDHGLRPESAHEAFQLKDWCQNWGWNFSLKKVTGKIPESNIEAWARKVRRECLLFELKEDEVLFLGHHIDDSFEWYLHQTVNSSKGDFTFGIPLKNGKIRRPFHCLTRDQILKFVRKEKIPFIKDSSNQEERFQRNALRKKVKAPLLNLFPKGLAHYVDRSNQWARTYGGEKDPKEKGRLARFSLGKGVVCFQKAGGNFRDFEKDILLAIKNLSQNERGSLRQNLEKLFSSLETHGRPGPLDFSGGVKIRMYGETLLIYNQLGEEELKNFEEKNLLRLKASQIPNVSLNKVDHLLQSLGGLPFVFYPKKQLGIDGLKNDPLFQRLIDEGREFGLEFRPLAAIVKAVDKMNDSKSREIHVYPMLR